MVVASVSPLEKNLSIKKLGHSSPAWINKDVTFSYMLYLTYILAESELQDLKNNL